MLPIWVDALPVTENDVQKRQLSRGGGKQPSQRFLVRSTSENGSSRRDQVSRKAHRGQSRKSQDSSSLRFRCVQPDSSSCLIALRHSALEIFGSEFSHRRIGTWPLGSR